MTRAFAPRVARLNATMGSSTLSGSLAMSDHSRSLSQELQLSVQSRSALLFAALVTAISGCSDRQAVAPDVRPVLDIGQDTAVTQVACVVAWSQPHGTVRTAELGRRQLPLPLPALETAQRTKAGRRLLRIVTTEGMAGRELSSKFGISCLVPSTFSNHAFAAVVRANGDALIEAAQPVGIDRRAHHTGSLGLTASDALNAAVRLRIQQPLVQKTSHVGGRPLASYAGVPPHHLPQMTITVSGSSLITNSSEIYWTLHHASRWSADGMVVSEQYPPGYCADATERWVALNAELDELEAARDAIVNAISSIAGSTTHLLCVPQSGSRKTCVDFFIMSATTFVTGFGDYRTFYANAPYGASRIQIYLDLDALTPSGHYYLSSSTAYVPLPTTTWQTPGFFHTADPYPHSPRDLRLVVLEPGKVKLIAEVYNGFCSYVNRHLCPAINAEITFTKQANGRWTTDDNSIDRDNYPSLGIYQQEADGSFSTIYEDAEGHWSALFGIERMLTELRRKISETLGGCEPE